MEGSVAAAWSNVCSWESSDNFFAYVYLRSYLVCSVRLLVFSAARVIKAVICQETNHQTKNHDTSISPRHSINANTRHSHGVCGLYAHAGVRWLYTILEAVIKLPALWLVQLWRAASRLGCEPPVSWGSLKMLLMFLEHLLLSLWWWCCCCLWCDVECGYTISGNTGGWSHPHHNNIRSQWQVLHVVDNVKVHTNQPGSCCAEWHS